MTVPPETKPNRLLPWTLLLVGLGAGFYAGYQVGINSTSGGPKGTCIRPDSVVVARNVTQQQCQAQCSTCMWQGN